MACAIVGSIIGMMTQTGIGTIFGGWIIGLGAKSLFLALIMTMLLSILLGTGIPTIPTYIITAALAAPALAKLGVPLIASHMFAFYYGSRHCQSTVANVSAKPAVSLKAKSPSKHSAATKATARSASVSCVNKNPMAIMPNRAIATSALSVANTTAP